MVSMTRRQSHLDPISQLNQFDHGSLSPDYVFGQDTFNHQWTCECVVEGNPTRRTQGIGASKREAKQAAASAMLTELGGPSTTVEGAAQAVLGDLRHAIELMEQLLEALAE